MIICILTLGILPAYGSPLPVPVEKGPEWGLTYKAVSGKAPKGIKSETFSPVEKQDYQNAILSHLSGINSDLNGKTVIYRLLTVPVKDYIFIHNKLYLISYQWVDASDRMEREIADTIGREYGTPHVKKSKTETIYTYSRETTQVIMYKTIDEKGMIKYQIYYYPKSLFRILFRE